MNTFDTGYILSASILYTVDTPPSQTPTLLYPNHTIVRWLLDDLLASTAGVSYSRGFAVLCRSIFKHANNDDTAVLGCR